jgi:hypothetical protein
MLKRITLILLLVGLSIESSADDSKGIDYRSGHNFMPTQRPAQGGGMSHDDLRAWEGDWYSELSPEPFMDLIRQGTAIVIDEAPDADVGSIGSYNILAWHLAGAVVVPRAEALKVAGFAHRIIEADKAGRRDLYEQSGRKQDASTKINGSAL